MKRRRFLLTLAPISVVLTVMIGLVAYSPTLYRWFCSATGYGGTVRRAPSPEAQAQAGVDGDKTIKVAFDSNVAGDLPWDFRPEQREVSVKLGEPTMIYYYAKNNSDKTMVARAVFNVTPAAAATYFFKIQCFCFTSERLEPGESAHMPVLFYIDKQAAADGDMTGVDEVTLSYTFYPQDTLTPDEIAKARDLGTGSAQEDVQLTNPSPSGFANDAPRD